MWYLVCSKDISAWAASYLFNSSVSVVQCSVVASEKQWCVVQSCAS